MTAENIARIVLAHQALKRNSVNGFKLQKLVYFCHAFVYTVTGKLLFEEKPQAWVLGPGYASLKHIYDEYNPISFPEDIIQFLEKQECEECNPADIIARFIQKEGIHDETIRKVVLEVLNMCGDLTPVELRNITHKDAAWQKARIGMGEFQPSKTELSFQDIRSFYQQFTKTPVFA